jgi:hypothetical protein
VSPTVSAFAIVDRDDAPTSFSHRGAPRSAGEPLPALDRQLDVTGIDLHRVTAPAKRLRCDDGDPRADERVVYGASRSEVVTDRGLEEQDWLLRRMVELLLEA